MSTCLFATVTLSAGGWVVVTGFMAAPAVCVPPPAAAATSLLGCQSYTIFYGSPTPAAIAKLRLYSLVVIEPRLWHPAQVHTLQQHGTKVLGYLSVLEQHASSLLLPQAEPEDYLWLNGERDFRSAWQSWSMDITSAHYQTLLLADYEQQIVYKGLHGVFLDTVGNVDDALWDQEVSDLQREGVAQFIAALRARYPTRSIMQNWGLTQLKDRTAPYIDGLLWENFVPQVVSNDRWSQDRMQELGSLQARGLAVFTSVVGINAKQKPLFKQLNRRHGYVGQVITSSYGRL